MYLPFVYDDGGRSRYFKGLTGDCAARAVAIATGRDYKEVYDLINEFASRERRGTRKRGISNARTGVYPKTLRKVMGSIGWDWVPTMSIGSGCTVHLQSQELPSGPLVVDVSHHFTCIKDGAIHDVFDPSRDGTRCVYGYFIRKGVAHADGR